MNKQQCKINFLETDFNCSYQASFRPTSCLKPIFLLLFRALLISSTVIKRSMPFYTLFIDPFLNNAASKTFSFSSSFSPSRSGVNFTFMLTKAHKLHQTDRNVARYVNRNTKLEWS